MTKLNYKQAAVKLGFSIELLNWFASYAVGSPPRKLILLSSGHVESSELHDFDAHLKASWDSRAIPEGIKQELKREARGMCGLCAQPAQEFDLAHIDRKGRELEYYCQHPRNLILLCVLCHRRYDNRGASVNNAAVHAAKERLIAFHLEPISRDVKYEEELRAHFNQLVEKSDQHEYIIAGFSRSLASVLANLPGDGQQQPLTKSVTAIYREASNKLKEASAPLTAGLVTRVNRMLEEHDVEHLDDAWDFPREEYECPRCGENCIIEGCECTECGHVNYRPLNEEMYHLETLDDGTYRVALPGLRPDCEDPGPWETCDECDNDAFFIEFDTHCGYCNHMWHRMMEDD